jgi:hypothetical protein
MAAVFSENLEFQLTAFLIKNPFFLIYFIPELVAS